MNAFVDCPVLPRSKIGAHFNMQEPISKGHRHTISNTLVAITVTCRNNNHVVRKLVLTNTAIENQLISCSLYSRGSRVHLVQEQTYDRILTSKFLVREINWGSPVHLANVFVEEGNTTNVSGFHLRHTQINHKTTKLLSDFGNNLTLTDTGRAPEKHGTLDLESLENCLTGLNTSNGEIVRYLSHFLLLLKKLR